MVAFGLAVELVGQKYKTLVGMLFNVPYSLGEVALGAAAAAGVRNWRNLHIAFGIPAFVMLAFTWFIPESPRQSALHLNLVGSSVTRFLGSVPRL